MNLPEYEDPYSHPVNSGPVFIYNGLLAIAKAIVYLADKNISMKKISGALISAVDAHGPITRENISSAAKRVYGVFKTEAEAK